jgi:hypothetical protein
VGKLICWNKNITRICHFRVYLILKKKQITREGYGVCCLSFSFQSYHVRDNTSCTVRTTLNHSLVAVHGLIIDIITQVMN